MDTPKYVRVETASEILDLSPHTVRDWVRLGKLPAHRLGGSATGPLRINVADIEALLHPVALDEARAGKRKQMIAQRLAALDGHGRPSPDTAA